MKPSSVLFLALSFVSTNIFAISTTNINVPLNPQKKIILKKNLKKVKAVNLDPTRTLSRAVITTRNCVDREFAVRARNGVNYRVYFNRINGQYARSSTDQMRVCNQNRQGYQAGDRINVSGRYQMRNGQKIIYNASLSN